MVKTPSVLALYRGVKEIMALHRPDETHDGDVPICSVCRDDTHELGIEQWPCPTYALALAGSDPKAEDIDLEELRRRAADLWQDTDEPDLTALDWSVPKDRTETPDRSRGHLRVIEGAG